MNKQIRFPLGFGLGLSLICILGSSPSFAATNDEELIGYDQIVRDLSAQPDSTVTSKRPVDTSDPFADVMIHGGIGLASTFGEIRVPGADKIRMNQQGMQAALGIDLFSRNWFAEGTARTFGNTEYNSDSNVRLKEFDLKLYYKDRITGGLHYRIGAGLTARYLTVESRAQGRTDYTTPASVVAGGVDMYLTRVISIGAEVTARNAIVDETIDKSSIDGTLRLDAHF